LAEMLLCPSCKELPLPQRGRAVCEHCGAVYHCHPDTGEIVARMSDTQDPERLAAFGGNLLRAVRWHRVHG